MEDNFILKMLQSTVNYVAVKGVRSSKCVCGNKLLAFRMTEILRQCGKMALYGKDFANPEM